jgi:tetratricopeptide (TPR) repeat protein
LNQLIFGYLVNSSLASNLEVFRFFVFLICSIFIIVLNYSTMQYDECIKDCDKAVERGRELRSDFKMIARALTRKGTALVKLAKTSKDYDIAIETFQKALTENRNPDTLNKLNDAERAKKELEQQEYFDPKIADEEREKGVLI